MTLRSPRVAVRYLVVFAITAGVLLAPFGASVLFLLRSGELTAPAEVASWLQRSGGIYGTALNDNLREMAFSIFRLRQPEVIVMSSSRGADFRREFFTRPFSCVCNMMSNIAQGQQFVEAATGLPAPSVAIIGLDYWWFSTTDDSEDVPWAGVGSAPKLTRYKVLTPYQWIGDGKLTVGDFFAVLAGRTDLSALSTEPKLGVQAIKISDGTRADGTWSMLGTASTSERPIPIDAYMNRMVSEPELILKEAEGRYQPDQRLDERRVEQLKQLVADLERRGTKVVLFLLPIVPGIIDVMRQTRRYTFIDELDSRLRELGAEYDNFLDPRSFGGSACEFQDPHHGGNVLSARMLKAAIDRDPRSTLARVVDYPVVADVTRRFAGRVVAAIGSETAAFREVDFLGIGCPK